MELAVAVGIQAVNWPLAALLAWRAARGRVPVVATVTVVVLLAAFAVGAWDPSGSTTLNRTAFAVGNMSLSVLFAVYPDGRIVPRWIAAPAAVEAVVQTGNIAGGFAWEETQPWWPAHFLVTWGLLLFGGQLYRYLRRSSVEERERTRWPVTGMLTMLLAFFVWWIAAGAGAVPFDATWLANLLTAIPAPAFALGLLTPRMLPVDRLLRVVLAVGLWAIGVALVAWGTSAAASLRSPDAAAWLTGMVTAIVAVPLALGTRSLADLVVRGRHRDPLRSLVALGDRLAAAVDPQAVPAEIVRTVTEALALESAVLAGRAGLAATSGLVLSAAREGVESVPIFYSGEQLGVLTVAPRPGEAALSEREQTALAQICAQAAPALHSARVVAELIDARARIVFTREEERRRLRRDLHDELAPTFAGLGLTAAALESYARAGDTRATDAASRLVTGLHDATRQLREIAYDLRPPVLDDRGLVAAIRERVEVPGAVPVVRVDSPAERLVLPAAVESAALRIVQEAVTNVRRHAAASECLVGVRVDDGTLRICVDDDGIGLRGRTRPGVGLGSMAERAAEVGGTLSVAERPGGGTRVLARLPTTVGIPVPS